MGLKLPGICVLLRPNIAHLEGDAQLNVPDARVLDSEVALTVL
jgi:hypothetical protein